MKIGLDATYSIGRDLSGVGVYSREILHGLAALDPEIDWRWYYRSHRWLRSLPDAIPPAARRALLLDSAPRRGVALFHGLNQRLPRAGFKQQIATFHDLFVMTAEYSTAEFRARFTAQARHAATAADHIVAVSEYTASQVVELLNVPRSAITVIHHGVRALPEVGTPPREKIVLHVGAIQKRKNLVRLAHAFGSLPADWRLVLAGSAGYGAEKVLDAIARSPRRDRIEVTGYVSQEDLARWYARASIFAFPSLGEGFGMPVLEAMAAGVPVMTSNNSALAEVAGDAALLVDPLSEGEIAAGLLRLATDRDYAGALTKLGRERVSQFTWDRACRATLQVYRKQSTLAIPQPKF